MLTVACVLKSGVFSHPGRTDKDVEYQPEDVIWLKKQVERHLSCPHRFVCLSDIEIPGVETIKLRRNWPGWWSKMELFAQFQQAFYLDLDTVIAGPLDDIVTSPAARFTALRNLSSKTKPRVGSGVMSWDGNYSFLYEIFRQDPDWYMAHYVRSDRWGDQGFIQDHLESWDYLQDKFPGAVVSYKIDMKESGDPPPGCSIVCFHGKPKPHEVQHKHFWVPQYEGRRS